MVNVHENLKTRFEADALPLMQELFGQAYHLTRNRADAEDLVQETFMRGMRKFAQFEPGTNLKAWLSRILFNQFVNEYRRNKRRAPEVHVEGVEKLVGESDPVVDKAELATMDPDALAKDRSFLDSLDEGLKGGLDEMDTRYRDVLLLNAVNELSYNEIASKLELPLGTVMSRLHRAKAFLREYFTRRNPSLA